MEKKFVEFCKKEFKRQETEFQKESKNKYNEVHFVIGSPGSCKTTTVKKIARSRGIAYLDIDEMIARWPPYKKYASNFNKNKKNFEKNRELYYPYIEDLNNYLFSLVPFFQEDYFSKNISFSAQMLSVNASNNDLKNFKENKYYENYNLYLYFMLDDVKKELNRFIKRTNCEGELKHDLQYWTEEYYINSQSKMFSLIKAALHYKKLKNSKIKEIHICHPTKNDIKCKKIKDIIFK